jgi:hypothetical protein
MRTPLIAGLVVLGLAAAIQLIPVDRTNPPVTADFDGPPDVASVVHRACFDCHSHETVWPWYARVAPVSWMVAHHVEEGREHLDLSSWGRLGAPERAAVAAEMAKEIAEGEMPLPVYVWMHSGARLSEADRAVVSAWSATLGTTPAP